jgi:hypothetical protein
MASLSVIRANLTSARTDTPPAASSATRRRIRGFRPRHCRPVWCLTPNAASVSELSRVRQRPRGWPAKGLRIACSGRKMSSIPVCPNVPMHLSGKFSLMGVHSKEADASQGHLDHLGREETKMRTIALVLAAFVASGAAAAQNWKEYRPFPPIRRSKQQRTKSPTAARSKRASIRCAKTIVC